MVAHRHSTRNSEYLIDALVDQFDLSDYTKNIDGDGVPRYPPVVG